MNPLLFADWARMNRLFIRFMWGVAAIMICVVCLAVITPGAPSHTTPAARSAAVAAAGTAR
jgi:hypothetical protein